MKELSPALLVSLFLHTAVAGGLLLSFRQEARMAGAPTVSVSLIDAVEAHRPSPQPEPAILPPEPAITPLPKPQVKPRPVPAPALKVPRQEPLDKPQEKVADDVVESAAMLSAAAQSTVTSEPISVASFHADYLHNPKPQYPPLSRRLGEQGRVLLHVQVSPEGSAMEVSVKESSGFKRLDQAAVDVVKRWQFVPAKQGSTPLMSWVDVPLQFSLEK